MSLSTLRPLLRTAPRAAFRTVAPAFRASRAYTSGAAPAEPAAKGPNFLLYGLIGAGVLGGGAFYALSGGEKSDAVKAKEAKHKEVDYQAVYNAVAEVLDSEDYDDGSYGPVLIRLAWHTSGSYDKETNTGGSNYSTMRFPTVAGHGGNAGLGNARDKLDPIKAKFPEISYGDLWTLAGVCAMQELGGPTIPWRAGRIDGTEADSTPDGRLPDGDKGADHIRKIFNRMGFNDQEIVALSGCHALGRCHTDRSGFDGPWTFSPTTMTNDYFKLLLGEKWNLRKWKGPIQYEDKKTKSIMMLTTDHALITDKAFKVYTELYAKDEKKFFDDFAVAFKKLIELGVPEEQFTPIIPLVRTEDQTPVKA